MNTLEFTNNCPECAPICLRDFWVTDSERVIADVYDISGSSFKSVTKVTFDEVIIAGKAYKVLSVKEVSSFGNTYYLYNISAAVPQVSAVEFKQVAGKIWNSGERWYYTGSIPFQLNWGFDRSNPAWSTTIG
jgi:hypothetical protein